MRWSDAVSAVKLLEIESLEDEASVEVLAFVLHGDLLQEVVPVRVGGTHLVGRHKVDALRDPLKTSFAFGCRVYSCC